MYCNVVLMGMKTKYNQRHIFFWYKCTINLVMQFDSRKINLVMQKNATLTTASTFQTLENEGNNKPH